MASNYRMEELISLHTSQGLTTSEVDDSRRTHGTNALSRQREPSALLRFARQFTSPLVWILLIVVGISIITQEYSDAAVIFIVLLVNACVGFVEEGRAKKIISSLQKLTATKTVVKRNGMDVTILTDEVVLGDIVELYDGDVVPADGVMTHATRLQVTEASITGESYPVEKHAFRFHDDSISLRNALNHINQERPDGKHLIFRSCTVSSGKGTMLVTAIGDRTLIGQIKTDVGKVMGKPKILEEKIHALTLAILLMTVIVCTTTVSLGVIRGHDVWHILETSISLGVSVIPSGLPIVVTIALAIGAYRVGQGKALLRNLPSAASLAGISVICTDKTGTLTEGKLTIRRIVPFNKNVVQETDDTYDNRVLMAAAKTCEVRRLDDGRIIGDALDIEIQNEVQRRSLLSPELVLEPTDEIPFDSRYKFSAKLYSEDGVPVVYVKGAPEVLLSMSVTDHNESIRKYIHEAAQEGIRTIAIAKHYLQANTTLSHDSIINLEMIGFIEFEDPVRPNIYEAIERCERLGITPLMITGDHIETARFVAIQTGIINNKEEGVYEADVFFKMSQADIERQLDKLRVIARATPQDKLKIIELFHAVGKKVAMTGDGVNDTPALAASDIGIAMGRTGTEVAKEAADMILTDDDFTHIVSAIVEARVVIENIRKVLIFLFATSIAEVILIIGTLSLGLPLPLQAAQILWLNLVTDGFLNAAMATEKKEDIVERRHAQVYKGELLFPFHIIRSIMIGSVMALGTLATYAYILRYQQNSILEARTLILILLVLFQWLCVFGIRTYKSVFKSRPFSNSAIVFALAIQVILQILAIYTPFGNIALQTGPIALSSWVILLVIASTVIIADEIYKRVAHEIHVI